MLQMLDIRKNQIKKQGLIALASHLKLSPPSLKLVCLWGNDFSGDGYDDTDIATAFRTNLSGTVQLDVEVYDNSSTGMLEICHRPF